MNFGILPSRRKRGFYGAFLALWLTLLPGVASAAIAFVQAVDLLNNGNTSGPYTVSYTIGGGANRLLVLAIEGDASTGNTADLTVTYNGVTMLQAVKNTNASDANLRVDYIYYLLDPNLPAAGTYNVVVNFGAGTQFIIMVGADYTGVLGGVDNTAVNTQIASSTSLTSSITTIADNCWVVVMEQHSNSSHVTTAGAGLTLRQAGVSFNQPVLLDSNGPVTPPASYSVTTNVGTAIPDQSHTIASFSPTAAVSTCNKGSLALMGVGC